ncbi:MAG: FHA domain-containing protein [Labilithrix sp.]|nr:FHA domain-containing protein [Labilithrix sp.]MBX3225197.1 FHA domain-containing protein [Labilithrix sp.]
MLLVDLGSTNGTRVNGVLVREARLYGGETVSLGRTVLGVETDQLRAANLPATLPPPADDFLANVVSEQLPFTEARQRVLAEFERRYVEELLARHNGNVTHAARASGIAHRYFQLVRARSR